jgi:hypothetical protein
MEAKNLLSPGFLAQPVHPASMLGLFAYFLCAAYLGFQVRRTRNAEGATKGSCSCSPGKR